MKNAQNSECCQKATKWIIITVAFVALACCMMRMKRDMAKKKGFLVYKIGHEVEIKKSNRKHDYNQCLESFGSICKGNCTAADAQSVCGPLLKKKSSNAKHSKKDAKMADQTSSKASKK